MDASSSSGLLQRAVEERVQHPPQGRLADPPPRAGGLVDELAPLLVVLEVALFLEDAEHRPDGGARQGVGHVLQHAAGRGHAAGVDDVHDLALAPAQLVVLVHRSSFPEL